MTILISFAVDSDKERSTDIGVCMNVYRQIFGFVSSISLRKCEITY
jgi:hypothetical protein